MGLPPLSKIPLILRPQAWLHRRHYGEVLSPIRWWGRIPFIFYLVSMFVGWLERKRSPLDPVVRSLVSARIAQMCLCEFCVDITSMKVAERTGSSDKLLAVADWRQSPLFSDEERLALEYAEAASVTPPTVDDALRTRLAAHFDAQALTELTALIGLQNLSARFNSAMDIPAQGLCRIPEKRSKGEMMRHCGWLLGLLSLFSLATHASDWQEIKNEAKGQTVWFNAWGGDTAINRYLDWVSGEMKTHYAINLKIVRLADAADAVKRIQTEAAAGRKTGGSVDLLWVNGENFRTLKEANLLQTGWAETLPNWRYVDTQLPVREDFSVPTQGAESPWGGAQLTFIARRDVTPQPPQTPQALLEFAKANPGTVTYPRPPDFTGTAFLEQLLIMLTPDPAALKEAPDDATFARVTATLWQYLDVLHPYLWREGKDFPPSPARMDALLKAGTLRLSLTFNPAHAQQKIASGDLPASSYSFGFREGMIGNVHFVTIPANANASAAAKVVANFLLSPNAQLRKADPAVWGDPSVLDPQKLPDGQRESLQSRMPQDLPPVLAEPHAGWVNALEQEWLHRYGTH